MSQAAGVYGVGGAGGAGGAPGVLGQGGSSFGNGVQGLSDLGVGVFAAGHTGIFASTSAPRGLAGQFSGDVFIGGNLTVTGKAKSVAVPFPDGSHRRLYCVESPESWFEDFGFGELSNGQAQVQLEEGFRSIVDSDAYHVFITEYEDNITEYEDNNALYVAERSSTGFLVRAKASQANGRFSYRVVAKRKDHVAPRFDKVELPPDPPSYPQSHTQVVISG